MCSAVWFVERFGNWEMEWTEGSVVKCVVLCGLLSVLVTGKWSGLRGVS